MSRLLFLVPILLALFAPVYYIYLRAPLPLPDFDYNEWWGPASKRDKIDTSVTQFQISFDDTIIKDLKDRLKRTRQLTPPLEGIAFEYGFNSKELDGWLKYWAEQYNFSERLKFLNKFPQFKTNIQGLDIHFIRVKPKVSAGQEVLPLLLMHGWPGSVREFYEAIPLLTAVNKDRDFAIEVIVPSLPGYGFSDAAVRPGLGSPQMAIVFRNLMHRLGFKKFYVQGGDWGGIIGSNMVTIFPEEVLGFHSNIGFSFSTAATLLDVIGSIYPPLIVESSLADRMYPSSKRYAYMLEESGYMHLQASKPDTVGVALSDSPAGLMAYILEKFSTWTRPEHRNKPDGGLEFRFNKDKLIDNLMFYWLPKCITTSMRLYSETFNSKYLEMRLDDIPTPVPTWIVQAKYEISYLPPAILKLKYTNLVNATAPEDGGHFLAFELPEFFAADVLQAMTAFRKLTPNKKTEL